jgi:hypothetical protein
MKTHISKRYYNHTKKSSPNKKGGSNSSQKCVFDKIDKIYQGECPGVKHFNEIKDKLIKDPNAVYTIFGHGCDLNNEVIKIDKPNCKYYTTTTCGSIHNNNRLLTKPFFDNTLNFDYGLDKYFYNHGDLSLENQDDISVHGVFGLYEHKYQDTYVNSRNQCFLSMGEYAGLRKMGDMKINNQINKEFIPPSDFKIKIQPYTLEMYYLQHFSGSIFPNTYQVCKLLHQNYTEDELNTFTYSKMNLHNLHDKFMQLIKDNFSIDFASIMDYLPGNFINMTCRPICKGPATAEVIIPNPEEDEFIIKRRKDSLSDYPIFFWTDHEKEYQELNDE